MWEVFWTVQQNDLFSVQQQSKSPTILLRSEEFRVIKENNNVNSAFKYSDLKYCIYFVLFQKTDLKIFLNGPSRGKRQSNEDDLNYDSN